MTLAQGLAWQVYAPTAGPLNGALAGAYVGPSGEIGVGVGVGANILFGGNGRAYALQPVRRMVESPVLGLWDRVFDDARLPAVKVSLFSRNPYQIDRTAALARLTEQFPEAFEGFEAYLRRLGAAW